jgi:2-polyprenyl-3-methyl-5-hydroxy-6-metoxy-1,4-benzoquinol methylase
MPKAAVQKLLGYTGFRISRIRSEAAAARVRQAPEYPVDPDEIAALERDLAEFGRQHPDCLPWSQPDRAREYLANKRIAFYHEVLKVCREQGIAFQGKDIGEAGSGTGYLLRLIGTAAPDCRLTGYDAYPEIVELARFLCPAATFRLQDFLEVTGEEYDVVYCTEVLEHLIRPDEAFRGLLKMLRPGGHLVLTVPDGRQDNFPAAGLLANGKGYWGHINFWSPESWAVFAESMTPEGHESHCGQLATGENWAVVHRRY